MAVALSMERNPSIVIVMTMLTMIIVMHKNCSPLPDRQVFLVQRGEGGRLGRTEAPTEYYFHDNIVEYYSSDYVEGGEGKVSGDDEKGRRGTEARLNIFLMIILFNIILKII